MENIRQTKSFAFLTINLMKTSRTSFPLISCGGGVQSAAHQRTATKRARGKRLQPAGAGPPHPSRSEGLTRPPKSLFKAVAPAGKWPLGQRPMPQGSQGKAQAWHLLSARTAQGADTHTWFLGCMLGSPEYIANSSAGKQQRITPRGAWLLLASSAQQHQGRSTTAASSVPTASSPSSTRRAHTPKPETFEFSPRVTEKSSAL